MAIKEIVWSELAKAEFANVLEFYLFRNGNANYSQNLLTEVEELLNILSQNELIGRLTQNKITRVIPIQYYLLFYEINNNRIEIVSFWDNRQDPEKNKIIF
ncbi:type II toxin-antitoxin system RelE/ParE family toxin [Flavobacterium sp. Sd200]|uniref:type II toxin-antitoxin system RelE/ParE family toxin n=1 Tax=Flavobacterium sp. Sd200 TaxID=2692211 RepID=UPI0013705195|nr:type II toxin-antitoxin system RelE/ParE family toxin [Flavobacterium sp. Sd200]MXN92808.1 type II toxin-antitoxin system RelE/ParE family toxin [Flavobacterium sp. Sd200]